MKYASTRTGGFSEINPPPNQVWFRFTRLAFALQLVSLQRLNTSMASTLHPQSPGPHRHSHKRTAGSHSARLHKHFSQVVISTNQGLAAACSRRRSSRRRSSHRFLSLLNCLRCRGQLKDDNRCILA